MYQYPYGNAQQLNLDWILGKIQELEAGATSVNIEEVANALVSASFDAGVSYRKYDYCFYNGKLYRALNDNSGAFNPADWLEVVLGDDIPVLTRLLNAVDTSLTSLQTTVGNQGNAITNLQNAVGALDSDDVDNASLVVSGDTVTDALDTLNSADNALQTSITATQTDLAPVLASLVADANLVSGDLRIYNNQLYRVTQAVSSGATLIVGTNIEAVNLMTAAQAAAGTTANFKGYTKLPDGTLIQWGNLYNFTVDISTPIGSTGMYRQDTPQDVYFEIPFINTRYFAVGSFQYGTGGGNVCPVEGNAKATDRMVVRPIDYQVRQGNQGNLCWFAIGRWKL